MAKKEIKKRKLENIEEGKERGKIKTLSQGLSDPFYQLKWEWAVSIVEFKLRMIDLELSTEYKRGVMQKMEHRIKKEESIERKLIKKGYEVSFENALEKLNDIVGVRLVCLYSDDVYQIAELLKRQKDFTLIKEKDYIKNPKKSGYQSYHLIMEVPVIYKEEVMPQRVEIQLRTVAMDYWAGVDNQICYKKSPQDVRKAEEELKNYSNIISKMDKQMLELRKKVEKM